MGRRANQSDITDPLETYLVLGAASQLCSLTLMAVVVG